MSFVRRNRLKAWMLPLSAATVLLFPAMTLADAASNEAALEAELKYIEALSNFGYPDFAERVIAKAQQTWKQAGSVLEAAKVRAELASGKQDEVLKKISARPDQNSPATWLLKLELAASYYQYSKYAEADKLYKEFFDKFKNVASWSESEKQAYANAAFYYIGLLNKVDRGKDALKIYELAIPNTPNKDLKKTLQAQYLQALLVQSEKSEPGGERSGWIDKAEKLAKEMVKAEDMYFGDAINAMAHAKMLKGDVAGAQELIKDFLTDLMTLHDQYAQEDPTGAKGLLRMSPLPQCRYLIGKMLYDQAQAELAKGDKADDDKVKNLFLGERNKETGKRNGQGAFQNFINVFANFPESQSAALAGDYAEEIQKICQQRYGSAPKANITPEQKANVRRQQYVQANVAFDAHEWDKAIAAFIKTISQYGLNKEALPAIRKMIEATVNAGIKDGKLDDYSRLQAETLTAALAEGFSGVKEKELYKLAGDELRRVADFYGELNAVDMKDAANELFFKYYPNHSSAVALQLNIAEDKAKAGDAQKAEKLYKSVAASATSADQRDQRTAALAALVGLYGPSGAAPDAEKELAAAKDFVAHFDGIERPGIFAANAQFMLGDAHRHMGEALRNGTLKKAAAEGEEASQKVSEAAINKQVTKCYMEAAKIYNALAKELKQANSKYIAASSERDHARLILEGCLFQGGVCLQRLPSNDPKKDALLKQKAVKYFEDYLTQFPKGKLAPMALLQIGTLQAAKGDVEASRETLAKLAKDFPDSDEAKNSIPMLADSLFKMGMKSEATKTYKQMFAAGGSYTPTQYLGAAEKLLGAGEATLAIEACDSALKKCPSALMSKAMLLRTRALLADKQSDAAYKQITEMLDKYGKTTAAIEGNHVLLEVIGAQILNAKTFEERNALIGKAKKAVTFLSNVSQREGTDKKAADAEMVRLNLAVAEVSRKAYEAEKKSGSDRVRNALGSALNAYRTTMFTGDTPMTDPAVSANVERAYKGYLELARDLAEIATAEEKQEILRDDIVKIGEEYKENFPNGRYMTDVTNMIFQANSELGE